MCLQEKRRANELMEPVKAPVLERYPAEQMTKKVSNMRRHEPFLTEITIISFPSIAKTLSSCVNKQIDALTQ